MIWKMIQRITAIPIMNDNDKKPLYEFLYTKKEHLGFTKEQDLRILKELYPDAKEIHVLFSVPGEAHFVLTH